MGAALSSPLRQPDHQPDPPDPGPLRSASVPRMVHSPADREHSKAALGQGLQMTFQKILTNGSLPRGRLSGVLPGAWT